jgi:hypothetical protein
MIQDDCIAGYQGNNASKDVSNDWKYQGCFILIVAIAVPIFVFACVWPSPRIVQHVLLWTSLALSLTGLLGTFLSVP